MSRASAARSRRRKGGSVPGTGIPASRARTSAAAACSRMVIGWCLLFRWKVGVGGVAGPAAGADVWSCDGFSPGGLRGAVGDGFVPSVLEALEQAVLDFGGDVGVGLLDPVAQDVPEASGLGDLGDAVGDHPRFVAVA
jgi:hypothetical protein